MRRLGEEREMYKNQSQSYTFFRTHITHKHRSPARSQLSWFLFVCVCFLIFLNSETSLIEGSGLLSWLGGEESWLFYCVNRREHVSNTAA